MSFVEHRQPFLFFLRPIILFVFLALPALLVIDDVRRVPGLIWATSIGLTTVFILSLEGSSRITRWLGCVVALVFALLNIGLALSFIVQGTAFNTAFFTHLDMSTLRIAFRTDGARMVIVITYILLAPVLAYWVIAKASWVSSWLRKTPALIKVGVLALGSWASYPIQSIGQHYVTTSQSSARLQAEIAELRSRPSSQSPFLGEDTRNLVLIYMESVEANYLDTEMFPALMPNLNALASEGLWFRDVQQFPGTGWTIGGIVSSHCGVPLLSESHGNMVLVEADNPFSQVTCMPEYLRDVGYKTAYIGGAPLDFAGKGNFLRDNGYDVVLGLDELPNSTGPGWGMFDDDLFAHVTKLFDGLVEGGDPFMLTTLTLDTHHPFGNPSPSCTGYKNSPATMVNAVHCADQLVNDFVAHIRASPVGEDTVIAIMSDHLLIQGQTKEALQAKDRKILFLILDSERPPQELPLSATHFDVAPTILETLGVSGATFAFGQSLLSHDLGRVFERDLNESDFEAFKIERLMEASE